MPTEDLMTRTRRRLFVPLSLLSLLSLAAAAGAAGCRHKEPEPGTVLDEAKQVGREAASFAAADEDYFHDMDGARALTPGEIKGRNTWIAWTFGNDRFWDAISKKSNGTLDFLKTISSHPKLKFGRHNRWGWLGLVNEPCFQEATGPDPERFGLWLDKPGPACPPDPFANEQKYPGVKIGARGKNMPVGSFYGYRTGIVGLRLFPNPAFDEEAAKKWDAQRYYDDPSYYLSKDLVKPYRIGMSCGFCHVGPDPTRPPADPENPKWENLSSNVGAQYFWVDRVFAWEADPTSFPYQIFHTARPGALDTSLVSTDYINNPRTMNAVYDLGARLQQAMRVGRETLAGGGLNNAQFNEYTKDPTLTALFKAPDTVFSPRVLKDGADSVGALGALNRVFLNIGLFSEEWMLHFNALTGGKVVTPIEISVARKNSSYWNANETQTPDLALFFLKTATAHKLKDAPGGAKFLTATPQALQHGKLVFAERCARCHSSKLPEGSFEDQGCSGPKYLDCWRKYWALTKTDAFKQQMRDIVLRDDFLDGNFLSSELRVPVTLLQTQACSPLASNAIAGSIWDNFSAQTYKDLPSVGAITVYHPVTGEPRKFEMPAGGRGYTRPASLISAWSTAPFLLNNSVGPFNPSPSVEARMASFDASIHEMLWPERRAKDTVLGDKVPGVIDRTTARSYLRIPSGFLPDVARRLQGRLERWFPSLVGEEGVMLGPIPAGTPVDLLANLTLVSEDRGIPQRVEHEERLVALLLKIKHDLEALPKDASDDEVRKVFANLVDPLLELNKCPDFIVNRGHYFGTDLLREEDGTQGEPGLSDADKNDLIEFLKTF
jgi:hypothetical protein